MKHIQKIWGIALIVMGVAVLFRVEKQMINLKQVNININIIKFSFYLLALFLIFGGVKKLFNIFIKNK